MRVLLSGGGTAGHINPAIAIADRIKKDHPDSIIAFVGTKNGMENRLVSKAGYDIYHVEVRGLQRSLSPRNILTAYYFLTAPKKARGLIQSFRPDCVIGTGGPLINNRRPESALKLSLRKEAEKDILLPDRADLFLDKSYVLYAAGLLAEREPDAALAMMKKSLCPTGDSGVSAL